MAVHKCYAATLKLHPSQHIANLSLQRKDPHFFKIPSYRYIFQRHSSFIAIQELT